MQADVFGESSGTKNIRINMSEPVHREEHKNQNSFKLEVKNIVFMDVFKAQGHLRISYNLPPFTKNSSRELEQSFITNETSKKQSRTSKSSTRDKSCLSRDVKYQYRNEGHELKLFVALN